MSHDASTRSDMPERVRKCRDRLQYQPGPSVDLRLALLAGVKQNTAHQMLYGEAGIRARALLIVQAFRLCGKNAREYFAPLLAALDEQHDASLARKIEADARENTAIAQYLTSGRAQVRRELFLALESGAAERLSLAALLRAEDAVAVAG
jgi:hypothetical protein